MRIWWRRVSGVIIRAFMILSSIGRRGFIDVLMGFGRSVYRGRWRQAVVGSFLLAATCSCWIKSRGECKMVSRSILFVFWVDVHL